MLGRNLKSKQENRVSSIAYMFQLYCKAYKPQEKKEYAMRVMKKRSY